MAAGSDHKTRSMNIEVHAIHFKPNSGLVEMVKEKVSKLSEVHHLTLRGDVYLHIDNNHVKENKVVELKLKFPGSAIVIKKEAVEFETALNLAVKSAARWLEKAKEKQVHR